MKNKILCGLLISVMCITLCSCTSGMLDIKTKEETTTSSVDATDLEKELINGISNFSKNHPKETIHTDINVKMNMEMETLGKFSMTLTGKSEFDLNTYYMNVKTTYYMGADVEEETTTEMYQNIKDGIMTLYEKSDIDGKWYKVVSNSVQSSNTNLTSSIDVSKFTKLDTTETDTEYTIVGKTTTEILDGGVSDLTSTIDPVELTITMIFDKETKEYKSIKFEFDPYYDENMLVTSTVVDIDNVSISNGLIEIPKDIVENAIEYEPLPDIEDTENTIDQ